MHRSAYDKRFLAPRLIPAMQSLKAERAEKLVVGIPIPMTRPSSLAVRFVDLTPSGGPQVRVAVRPPERPVYSRPGQCPPIRAPSEPNA